MFPTSKIKPPGNGSLFLWMLLLCIPVINAQDSLLINTYNRPSTSLNGVWNYIVDPYENGFYNYRLEAFEDQEDPGQNAFFTNAKPSSPSDLIEYDFDLADSLLVPGDWNTQKEKLFYYEGSLWYKTSLIIHRPISLIAPSCILELLITRQMSTSTARNWVNI